MTQLCVIKGNILLTPEFSYIHFLVSSHFSKHITWIITVPGRAEQIMLLKEALINNKAAAVKASVRNHTLQVMCACVRTVYVREGEQSGQDTRLHETYPYWCCIYHHRLPALTCTLLFDALIKSLEASTVLNNVHDVWVWYRRLQ